MSSNSHHKEAASSSQAPLGYRENLSKEVNLVKALFETFYNVYHRIKTVILSANNSKVCGEEISHFMEELVKSIGSYDVPVISQCWY